MRVTRKSILGLGLALTLASAGLVSAHGIRPVEPRPDACVPTAIRSSPSTGTPAAKKNCEQTLANCMNNGGDSDRCWNAYWSCIS